MKHRIAQLFVAELFAFAAFVLGGLAVLGGSLTLSGDSRYPAWLSWVLVALFGVAALALGRTAVARLRRAFGTARASASIPS